MGGPAARPGPVVLGARVLAAAAVGVGGWVHLDLWLQGYRDIPQIGPLFLLDAVASGLIALVLLATGRVLALAVGLVWQLGAIVALVVSTTVGLLGFHETGLGVQGYITASYAAEAVAGVLLVFAVIRTLAARPARSASRDRPGGRLRDRCLGRAGSRPP